MSFPLVYWGPDGEQYNTYTDPATGGEPRYRLGQQLVLRDGRKFRFARAGASALAAGDVQQAAANTANHVDLAIQAAGKVNDTTFAVTLGATAVVQDEYMDGVVVSVGTAANGGGMSYAIAEHHAAVTSAGTFTVPLAAGVTIQLATTTSGFASLIHHPYRNTVKIPATLTQVPVGVACSAPAANAWGWLQTRGLASTFQHGTLVIGSLAAVNVTLGAVDPHAANDVDPTVGIVAQVSAKTYSPVFLMIDG